MKIHKFEGATMRDAIAKVKAELGEQAVIISTRQVRKGLLGIAIEIAAAVEDGDDAPAMAAPAFTAALPERAPARAPEADVEKLIAPLRTELRSLRALVRASGDSRGTTELRTELAALRKLVEELRTPAAATPVAPAAPARSLIARSTGRVVLLVGPTGAGKTTTIAKIAARAALVEGRSVSLITLDNYRVGGVDQIRAFADLIGVPLAVAEDAAALRDVVDESADLTLIDTAGRSPRESGDIEALAAILPQLPPVEVHLVIPAASSPAAIDALVARFRPLRPARLLFTKIDEVDTAAELSLAPARHQLPITWVTTGQQVPEDIEEPTAPRVLELASRGLGAPSGKRAA
jgi:flagellar biosynthesis protein FlhF